MSASPKNLNKPDIEISIITDPADLPACQDINSACFGNDAIFNAFNPGWQTPDGRERAIKRLGGWLSGATRDKEGRLNTIFLKATVPISSSSSTSATSSTKVDATTTTTSESTRKIVGFAIWAQFSSIPGHGDPPPLDFAKTLNVTTLYPDNPKMQRCTAQMVQSLTRQRYDIVRALAAQQESSTSPPALLACDLCLVHPTYQGKGVGKRLIQWGLDEAEKRGGLECVLEASVMGRGMYQRLGFVEIGPDIPWDDLVDVGFVEGMVLPSTVFMRTRPGASGININGVSNSGNSGELLNVASS